MCGDGKWNHIIFNSVTRAGMLPSAVSEGQAPLLTQAYFPGHSSGSALTCCQSKIDAIWWTQRCRRQTTRRLLPAPTLTGIEIRIDFYQTKQKHRQPLWFGNKDSRRNLEWLHHRQLHNNRRFPLSQKSLKVTEWILIRSGVVNSSQHGLQWD